MIKFAEYLIIFNLNILQIFVTFLKKHKFFYENLSFNYQWFLHKLKTSSFYHFSSFIIIIFFYFSFNF